MAGVSEHLPWTRDAVPRAAFEAKVVMGCTEISTIWNKAARWGLYGKVGEHYRGSFHSMQDLFSASTKLPSSRSSVPRWISVVEAKACSCRWSSAAPPDPERCCSKTPSSPPERQLCWRRLTSARRSHYSNLQGIDLINPRSAKRGSMLAVVLMQRFLQVPASAPANARCPDETAQVPADQGQGLLFQ